MIELIVITALIENRQGFLSFIVLLVSLAVFEYFTITSLYATGYNFITTYPLFVLGIVASYVFIGILWSFLKWYMFLKADKKYQLKVKKVHPSTIIIAPYASDHITDIVRWMGYWPFSMFWFIISKPYRYIYDLLSDIYDNITKSVFNEEVSK